MSATTTPSSARVSQEKRGALSGGALTDEVFDSSRSLLRPARGRDGQVAGLQQYFSPPELADMVAGVNGASLSTLDLTAGDGSLLAGVDRDRRFGIEIDADQVDEARYEPIRGDVQDAYPMLHLLGTRFPRVACNPPFGLDWQIGGRRESSTLAAWRMAIGLLRDDGAGAFVAGRDRFRRSVLPREDAGGIYALVDCEDLFEGVALPGSSPAAAARLRHLGSPSISASTVVASRLARARSRGWPCSGGVSCVRSSELRRQGVKPTGEEIAEADIEAAWKATQMLSAAAGPRPPGAVDREGMTTVDWHNAPVESEQLDLFAAAA